MYPINQYIYQSNVIIVFGMMLKDVNLKNLAGPTGLVENPLSKSNCGII